MKKTKIIMLVGPTAVGKTDLSIKMAKKFNGEIISGDSMQIYRGLDIGTAKVSEKEAAGVPHHLIDIVTIDESYSVSDFQKMARETIAEITEKGKIPLVVGGTGLYIEALLYDLHLGGNQAKEADPLFRQEMEEQASKLGNHAVWSQLNEIDPTAAKAIHENNLKRVIRALEVFHLTGIPFSKQQEQPKREAYYDALVIGLTTDRDILYQRINQRVDLMIRAGLLEEAQWLKEQVASNGQATLGIGYKELFPYLDGELSLEAATNQIKQNSRRYAKRQLTWFRNRMEFIRWYDLVQHPETEEQLFEEVTTFLQK